MKFNEIFKYLEAGESIILRDDDNNRYLTVFEAKAILNKRIINKYMLSLKIDWKTEVEKGYEVSFESCDRSFYGEDIFSDKWLSVEDLILEEVEKYLDVYHEDDEKGIDDKYLAEEFKEYMKKYPWQLLDDYNLESYVINYLEEQRKERYNQI